MESGAGGRWFKAASLPCRSGCGQGRAALQWHGGEPATFPRASACTPGKSFSAIWAPAITTNTGPRGYRQYGITDGRTEQVPGNGGAGIGRIVQQIDGVLSREVGKFMLKGKTQPITVHELLGRLEEADQNRKVSGDIRRCSRRV